jgi:acyl carrier protein
MQQYVTLLRGQIYVNFLYCMNSFPIFEKVMTFCVIKKHILKLRIVHMNQNKVESFVIEKITEFSDDNDIELNDVGLETRLIGSSGVFDSMDLVNFIVELEENIEESFDIEISLADEKAMSRRTSPFVNVKSLSTYIIERINE